MTPQLKALDKDIRLARQGLRALGVPSNMLDRIKVRAYKTGRRQSGEHATNRENRWEIDPGHPQYGSEVDCKIIYLKLLAMLFTMDDVPDLDSVTREILERHLGKIIVSGTYRDALTLEKLSYRDFLAEIETSKAGHSNFHIGHDDPTMKPRHVPDNISWRTLRSNLIQGDTTLIEARTSFVRLIARYFELGEVAIVPH